MGKHKRLTPIELFLILAIIAVLVVWLFPRFLKILDSNSATIGTVKPYIIDASATRSLNKSTFFDLGYPLITDCSQT